MYANITNPANFQLQDFAQFGFRVITTDFIPVPGEQYRTLYVLQDAVVTATTQKGDDITSKAILAGTLLHGLFNSVSITSGRVLAYAAGRVTAEEIIALYEAYVIALGGTLENAQCAVDTINEDGVDFFADASLVMIPEGYATGVVYGQRPLTSDSQLTFTRASTATRVGPDGAIEKVRTNLILQSNQFDTTWLNINSTETGGQVGYDGTNNAWLLDKNGSNGRIQQVVSVSGVQTFSVYAKKGTSDYLRIYVDGSTADSYFDLTNGTFVSGSSYIAQSVTDVGGGWYRCSLSFNGSSTVRIYPAEFEATGATSGNIYIQDAQLESGDIVTPYIPTTTTAVSVGILSNVPRIDYTGGGCGKLLLEPQRTNLITFSEQFDNAAWAKSLCTITANQIVSPSGYLDADLVTTSGTSDTLQQSFSVTSGTTYTFSGFIKSGSTDTISLVVFSSFPTSAGTYNLTNGTATSGAGSPVVSIQDYGNGWYRATLTATATSTGTANFYFGSASADAVSTYHVWGAQVEVGAYVTSYIPTLGSSVTRLADACSKAGISNLIGQTQGTIFLEFTVGHLTDGNNILWNLSDGTSGNSMYSNWYQSGGQNRIEHVVNVGGVPQVGFNHTIANGTHKLAFAYKANDFIAYVDGVAVGSDTSGSVPTASRLSIGSWVTAAFYYSGNISQALLFKTRLTNEQLQKLTTL